ncbi:MAG: M3 family oligoendopeptidase [Anaerolineales bacterium]|nr:M3 family oligoendopeptidase [Anaerolineales bacterium]
MSSTPLRWDLSNVYPALDSDAFSRDFLNLQDQITEFETFFAEQVNAADAGQPAARLAEIAGQAIDRFNQTMELSVTLEVYIYSFVSTDSHNTTAKRKLSELEQVDVRLQKLRTRFKAWVGMIAARLDEIIPLNPSTQAHAFMLQETAEQSKYMMSPAEESLAADLTLSGANAWNKLQGTVTSQLTVEFELDGEVQQLPSPALVNLRAHPDEAVRRRGYEAELEAWKSIEETLAACMNGVKGAVNTLNERRGREDAVHSAVDSARMDRTSLETMLGAMKDSLPMFRKYFKAKARRFGQEKLPWWNIFAPTGKAGSEYTFGQARDFILENFEKFSPELSDFARRAFDNNWIDAEQREGKRGGAFCMEVPAVKESRILSNFDGSLDQISTIAHELGHAFHNECAFQAGKTILQQDTPMTLAETASITCETIVMQAVLEQASDPQEELAILETSLIGSSQVIVDIYSRYLFEKEVFERRAEAELSADDLCEIMERAQKETYGDGLDEHYLQKYMWTWKPHYYYHGLSFYNFPYAFGLLFGAGLYAIYQQRGAAFVPDYKNLLASTGEASAADLAARFGIDIRTRKFWEDSLSVIGKQIERYCEL